MTPSPVEPTRENHHKAVVGAANELLDENKSLRDSLAAAQEKSRYWCVEAGAQADKTAQAQAIAARYREALGKLTGGKIQRQQIPEGESWNMCVWCGEEAGEGLLPDHGDDCPVTISQAALALPTDGTALREAQAEAWEEGLQVSVWDTPNPYRTPEKK